MGRIISSFVEGLKTAVCCASKLPKEGLKRPIESDREPFVNLENRDISERPSRAQSDDSVFTDTPMGFERRGNPVYERNLHKFSISRGETRKLKKSTSEFNLEKLTMGDEEYTHLGMVREHSPNDIKANAKGFSNLNGNFVSMPAIPPPPVDRRDKPNFNPNFNPKLSPYHKPYVVRSGKPNVDRNGNTINFINTEKMLDYNITTTVAPYVEVTSPRFKNDKESMLNDITSYTKVDQVEVE